MPADRRPRGPSRLLLVVLLAAVAIGASASVLVASRTAGPPPPVGPSQIVLLPNWFVAVLIVVVLAVLLAPPILDRLLHGRAAFPGRFLVFGLTVLLLLIGFVALMHVLGFGGPGGTPATSSDSGNATVPPPSTSNTSNSTSSGTSTLVGLHFPSWLLFVVVLVVAVAVALVGAPRLYDYLQDRREERWQRRQLDEAAVALQQALARAGRDLDAGADPRTVILALYARLLAELTTYVASTEHETAEEIRGRHLVRLGVRPAAAEALTRLFEEARYSSHPMGLPQVDRARAALRDAEADLAEREIRSA
jgi:hypothetical protein